MDADGMELHAGSPFVRQVRAAPVGTG
jgi:hypothetical protein